MALIDREATMDKIHDYFCNSCPVNNIAVCNCCDYRGVMDEIKAIPTVDAKPVVLCKDCQWCYECAGGELRCENSYERNNMDRTVTADFFCADGERKDDDE